MVDELGGEGMVDDQQGSDAHARGAARSGQLVNEMDASHAHIHSDRHGAHAHNILHAKVRKQIASTLLRRLQYGQSQKAFEAEIADWKNCGMLDESFSEQIPDTYAKCLRALERDLKHKPVAFYIYDICPTAGCPCVYRCEFRDLECCPRCKAKRYKTSATGKRRAAATMLYGCLLDYVRCTFTNPYLVEVMDAYVERQQGKDASKVIPCENFNVIHEFIDQ